MPGPEMLSEEFRLEAFRDRVKKIIEKIGANKSGDLGGVVDVRFLQHDEKRIWDKYTALMRNLVRSDADFDVSQDQYEEIAHEVAEAYDAIEGNDEKAMTRKSFLAWVRNQIAPVGIDMQWMQENSGDEVGKKEVIDGFKAMIEKNLN